MRGGELREGGACKDIGWRGEACEDMEGNTLQIELFIGTELIDVGGGACEDERKVEDITLLELY